MLLCVTGLGSHLVRVLHSSYILHIHIHIFQSSLVLATYRLLGTTNNANTEGLKFQNTASALYRPNFKQNGELEKSETFIIGTSDTVSVQ